MELLNSKDFEKKRLMELQETENEKRYKWKFVERVKIPAKIIQTDTKYIKIKDKTVYQFAAVDLVTRYVWMLLV